MASVILSKAAKEYLNQDPEYASKRQLYRLAWSRSSLAPHPRSNQKRALAALGSVFHLLQAKVTDFLEGGVETGDVSVSQPKLREPFEISPATFRLPRYFAKGALENDKKKNPAPIPYLLTETNEISRARPVPGNSWLIRSLCKGKGILRQNQQGLVYLDIENRFISSLIPYLKAYDLVRPPYFNLFGSPDGAHIPVIPSREAAFQYIEKVGEVDQSYPFEILGLYSIEPATWPEVEQVWFFKIHSPELEKLRRRYFLPALPGGHSFHIAVAVKPRGKVGSQPPFLPAMRINVGYLAA